MRPSTQEIAQRTEQLRLDFLECVLETTRTYIELTEFELNAANLPHSGEGIRHIAQGLSNVRKIVEHVSSSADQARIYDRLAQLEVRAAELKQRFAAQQHLSRVRWG